ncbi:MAG: crossover junction endodeoxyribonuclease RuvC, partial [Bdellovibrionales bacterium]|nr:crossover junction endodeoxyribonuclease RuvC [Bdellovibrionales bacterium]
MKILGIDPGSYRMGFGLIEKTGNQMSLLHCETIESRHELLEERLRELGLRLNHLLDVYRPNTAVVEQVFLGKN